MNSIDVFNQIAPGWYNFRHWSIFRHELEVLAQKWQKGKLLNLGCAHGPDFLPFRQSFELYGVDFSLEMLRLARKYSQKFDFVVNLLLADVNSLQELDEKDLAGFVLIGVADGKKLTFQTSMKKMNPVTVLGAIEQYKHMFLKSTFDKPIEKL